MKKGEEKEETGRRGTTRIGGTTEKEEAGRIIGQTMKEGIVGGVEKEETRMVIGVAEKGKSGTMGEKEETSMIVGGVEIEEALVIAGVVAEQEETARTIAGVEKKTEAGIVVIRLTEKEEMTRIIVRVT